MNKTKKNIKEYTSSVNGNPSFQGGSFGFGGTSQLVNGLNPATQEIADQTEEEHNTNIQNLKDRVGNPKKTNSGERYADFSTTQSPGISGRQETDMFAPAPHGPGSSKDNKLANPKTYVPREDPRETDDYLIDDMVEELAESIINNLRESDYVYKAAYDIDPKNSGEELGHTVEPTADVAAFGMGAVLLPKSFVPEDEISKTNQRNPTTGEEINESFIKLEKYIKKLVEKELKEVKCQKKI